MDGVKWTQVQAIEHCRKIERAGDPHCPGRNDPPSLTGMVEPNIDEAPT